MKAPPSLELDGFGVAFGEKVVLADVTLEVPRAGVVVVVGPGGVGKSTLLRTISGANDGNPSLRTWGSYRVAGKRSGAGEGNAERPALLVQKAKLLIGTVQENVLSGVPGRGALTPAAQRELAKAMLREAGVDEAAEALDAKVIDLPLGLQRRIALVRTTASNPALLCADEPTSDLPEAQVDAIVKMLRAEGERRGVLIVLHNQRHARALGGTTALVAGGRVHEVCATEEFFTAPLTRAAQQFARTGSCDVPSPGAKPEELEDGVVPPSVPSAARTVRLEATGPRGFRWLVKGRLGGTPRPGLLDELELDLKALRGLGTTVLVTLETEAPALGPASELGMKHVLFPIPDMKAPSIEAGIAHCKATAAMLADGEVVVMHCRGGLGRTGTMLAAQLIYEGSPAVEALHTVRSVEPGWVQSDEQMEFLERFERATRGSDFPGPRSAR